MKSKNKSSMPKGISIILADDHPLLRKGLKDIIAQEKLFHIVGEAGDGKQALEMIMQLKPSIAVIDIHMPQLNGLEVVKALGYKNLPVKIIVLTMYDKENIFNEAMDLGVKGYVMKDCALTEIVEAIKSVAGGKYYISASLSDFLVNRNHGNSYDKERIPGFSKLTSAERKILKLIASNMTTKEIANELFLSIHTIETHRANICQKLNLHGTNALLHFVLENPDLI